MKRWPLGLASRYLKSMAPPGGKAFVLGSPALKVAVLLAGLEIVAEGDHADVVVIGLDRTFSYTALSHAVRLVGAGAAFLATSLDPVLLTEEGVVPGAVALIAAVRACVDAAPVCVGQPSPGMFEMAMSLVGVPAGESLVVGDNMAADIAGGAAAGARTALLLSGVTKLDGHADGEQGRPGGCAGSPRPDFVFPGLAELSEFLWGSWAV